LNLDASGLLDLDAKKMGAEKTWAPKKNGDASYPSIGIGSPLPSIGKKIQL